MCFSKSPGLLNRKDSAPGDARAAKLVSILLVLGYLTFDVGLRDDPRFEKKTQKYVVSLYQKIRVKS